MVTGRRISQPNGRRQLKGPKRLSRNRTEDTITGNGNAMAMIHTNLSLPETCYTVHIQIDECFVKPEVIPLAGA